METAAGIKAGTAADTDEVDDSCHLSSMSTEPRVVKADVFVFLSEGHMTVIWVLP